MQYSFSAPDAAERRRDATRRGIADGDAAPATEGENGGEIGQAWHAA